ncbi:MAG TPA: VWA domain-containing protein [Elusimicrobia bacterium]|nr:VWA domain-containing protein [Elusimicrobiota bacterium]HBT60336.1 VWA domain-containing protein [Elusimicrobiota bacterium]
MKKSSRIPLILSLAAALAATASAEPLENLATKLEAGLKDKPVKQVAVLNFGYHDGASSSGSTIVQERLTTYLVQGGKLQVVERGLLKKALEELKLETTGVMDPKTTQELGKLLGAEAVVLGTLNDLSKKKTEVNARVIETATGKILAAAQAKISRTWSDDPSQPQGNGPVVGPTAPQPATPSGQFLGKALVQIAVLLDTSNSMDGLISQAKNQLWRIVNEFTSAEKGGNNPTVQVALYEYGNDQLASGEGYIRQVLPFTTDLDKVSEQLFALKTNGGQEYCGWVVRDAVNGLQWDKHADVYKTVFIAGNEPFTQGPVDFRESAAEAAKKGIAINTIFCGGRQEGLAMQWKAGAEAGNGDYANIDQAAQVVSVQAPQDPEIQRLAAQLNDTFIAYGDSGRKAFKRQAEMDNAAMAAPASAGVAVQRSMAKASKQYSQASSWDVVSALESGQLKPEQIKKEELPQELQSLSDKDRAAYIEKKTAERKAIQAKINQLSDERRKYVAQKEKELATQGSAQTLGQAVITTVRSQASKKGFKFK